MPNEDSRVTAAREALDRLHRFSFGVTDEIKRIDIALLCSVIADGLNTTMPYDNVHMEYGLALDPENIEDATVVAESSEPSDPARVQGQVPGSMIVTRRILFDDWKPYVEDE